MCIINIICTEICVTSVLRTPRYACR